MTETQPMGMEIINTHPDKDLIIKDGTAEISRLSPGESIDIDLTTLDVTLKFYLRMHQPKE